MLLGDPNSQEHKHTMYTFTSCRQAHQHRRLLVNVCFVLFFLEVELWSAPSPPQPPAGPCHAVKTGSRSGKSAPRRLTGSGGGAQLCPALGHRERKGGFGRGGGKREKGDRFLTRGSVDRKDERKESGDDGGSRHSRGRRRMPLLLGRGGRRCGGGRRGDLLGALPVLLCSRARPGSGAGSRGGGLGGAGSRGGGGTRTLGVVHVLGSGPGVRLPVGVVVLLGGRRRTTVLSKVSCTRTRQCRSSGGLCIRFFLYCDHLLTSFKSGPFLRSAFTPA